MLGDFPNRPTPTRDTGHRRACHRYSEATLELYSLGRLPEGAEAALEEHLLVCEPCMDLLAAIDRDTAALCIALRGVNARKTGWERLVEGFSSRAVPKLVWVAVPALALVLLVGVPVAIHRGGEPPVALELRTFRSDPGTPLVAPPGRPLQLRLAAEGLPEGPGWSAHIVDRAGNDILSGTLEVKGSSALFPVTRGLSRGDYWVQLRSSREPEHPVREYQLTVR